MRGRDLFNLDCSAHTLSRGKIKVFEWKLTAENLRLTIRQHRLSSFTKLSSLKVSKKSAGTECEK